ncbi:MAG: aminotransferase class I/II-fold pyridoxal phosphate-dependent enzyme [Methanosarcinaceae archaeon]|nr:aminotransferase class I/II-fold pyridoxal phosphate-dependent enzyme [Methanosarcinaceae archaeon]
MSTIQLSDRVGLFTESVIRDMTRLAIGYNAINLAQGFPDFGAPEELKEAAISAIRADHNQYAITWGAQELRDAIAKRAKEFNNIRVDPNREVTVTCGATEAMMASMLALINPGDEAIIFEPFYENYGPDAAVSGAVPRFVPLDPDDFSINEEALVSAFNKNTKVIVVNTPNNPSGKVFTKRDMKLIADLCHDHNVVAITDEIYEHIIYDGKKHISLASVEGMQDRTITISGASKTYSVTGWRIGYTIANEELTNAIRKIHDFLTVGAPAPLQHAAAKALAYPDSYYSGLVEMYDRKRHMLFDALTSAGFKCILPQGAYYILADISELSGGMDDVEFAKYLVKEVGVACVPGSSFYTDTEMGKKKVRFTFSKQDSTLQEAAIRLESLNDR